LSFIIILFMLNLSSNYSSNDVKNNENIGIIHQPISIAQESNSIISSRANEPVTFDNVSNSANITYFRSDSFAWGDYNNDGYLDFLARGNKSMGTRLFRNNGPPNWNFTDISVELNLTGSGPYPNRGYPIWGDYDNDGYLDFFVAGDHDQLWRNNGPPAWNFTNVTIEAGNLDDNKPSEAAAWADYDRDGYLDLYVNSWYKGSSYFWDVLWHNNGDGTFTDVSNAVGIYNINTPSYMTPPFAGMAVAWGDYNNDGWLDIYVGKYHVNPNSLFRNNHDGTFTDVALDISVAGNPQYYGGFGPGYGHTAGVGWADFNNNGDLDLWVSNLAHKDSENYGGLGRGYYCDDSMMYKNSGAPKFEFEDKRKDTGIPITPVGATVGNEWKDEDYFGVTWGDYDNDCDIDLWLPQVNGYHSWAYSYLWQNNNNETFTDVSDNVGIKVWSNTGAAWGDYNNDGFLDLITEGTHPYQGPRKTRLFKNNGNSNNWLQLRLNGVISNTAAIGTRIYLTAGSVNQTREIGGDAGGHGFQNSFVVEFGLGTNSKADEIKIIWPSGVVQVLRNVNANQILNVTEDTSGPKITDLSVSKLNANEGESLIFQATISGSAGKYQWDFDNDGIIDWESTTGLQNVEYTGYKREGNYTAKFWVWDSNQELGWTETTDFIFINNLPPVVNAGQDIEVWEDQIIEFNAHNCTDTPLDIDTLEYNWTFDDGNYSGWQKSPLVNHSYTTYNDYFVTLKVRDNDNEIESDTILVEVKNKLPNCEITADEVVVEDSVVTFSVESTDTYSDLPFLVHSWDFGDGNNTYWSNETSVTHSYTQKGKYIVRCTVRDDDRSLGENYSEVIIRVYNVAPEGIIDEDKSCYEDQKVYLNGSGFDTTSDQNLLRYFWDFADGTTSGWLSPGYQNITHTYTKKGIYPAKLIIEDDDGAECIKIVNVTVLNVPPRCEGMDNFDTYEDEPIQLICTASWDTKSDIGDLEYSWDLDVAGLPPTPWNSTPQFEFKYTDEGEYNVVLTVRDDDGDTGNAGFKIRVRNIVPEAKFSTSASKINEEQTIEFDASQSKDTDSDLATLKYLWTFGDKSETQTGWMQSHRYHKAGEYNVVLEVIDDNDKSDTLKKIIKVNNLEPTAVITVSTRETYPNLPILFSGEKSSDTISDRANLTFEWDFGGNILASGENVVHNFTSIGKQRVTLTVTDDDNSQDSAEITIIINDYPSEGEVVEDTDGDINAKLALASGLIGILVIILLFMVIFYFIKSRKQKGERIENHLIEDHLFDKRTFTDQPEEIVSMDTQGIKKEEEGISTLELESQKESARIQLQPEVSHVIEKTKHQSLLPDNLDRIERPKLPKMKKDEENDIIEE